MDPTKISNILENSLSQTLSLYYPYAGRLKDNTIVDRNDAGAEFVQVQINSPISESLQWHNNAIEEMIFPQGLPWSNCTNRALVVAQISYFNCGGIVVSMCISHKVGDGHSGYNFFMDWAITSREPNLSTKPCLYYVEKSIFPPPPNGPFLSPLCTSNKDESIHRRYTFLAKNLMNLRPQ
ncbi:PREDICTED: acylsugar acyltransferase 3-like [Nicotiana attenuata]|uniref:Acylsugar acyltransferase 3 n=1 Tax=Nicotiana attenuata TaxID=49451 RepID=A0A314L6T3_NICAT|nr:PREDICTED: acylsugar acyltransferase 3-like [Nicotiana attenuata]OIT37273.1 acylsugar acyltransferase 3 [Nicotiana attenuata]